jgi:hypothetical protein
MFAILMTSVMPAWVYDLFWWLIDSGYIITGVEGAP